MDFINSGLIALREPPPGTIRKLSRTLVVSGVARSGTSMVARVLAGGGVFMGEHHDEVVFEDHECNEYFGRNDLAGFERLVRRRNRQRPVWGFKRPHLHVHGPDVIASLRNPLVILTVRDPVAVAERNVISEHRDPVRCLSEATADLTAMVSFAASLPCPALLVSYEKAIQSPRALVDRLVEFCGLGLQVPPERRDALALLVEPDRPAYRASARRRFDGYLDRITGGVLHGWAWQQQVPEPLALTLFLDEAPVLDFTAADFRADLAAGGIGSGRHAFAIDLAGFAVRPETRVAVRVHDCTYALHRSGDPVAVLDGGLLEQFPIG